MPHTQKSALTRRKLLQNGVAIAVGATAFPEFFLHESHAQSAEAAGRTWTIGNESISRTIASNAGRGLYTQSFSDLATGTKFIAPDKPRSIMTAEYYLCGPPMMIKACTRMLADLGVPPHQIAYDEF